MANANESKDSFTACLEAQAKFRNRYRDSSDQTAFLSRDFRRQSVVSDGLKGQVRRISEVRPSAGASNLVSSNERLSRDLRGPGVLQPPSNTSLRNRGDIIAKERESGSIKDMRDILSQVKCKYRNSYYPKTSSQLSSHPPHTLSQSNCNSIRL